MARRERTTGLPRPRPRTRSSSGRRFAGISWGEAQIRLLILAVPVVLLVLVGSLLSYRYYVQNYQRPHTTILTVGDQKFSLSYYAARLVSYVQAQAGTDTSLALAEQSLLGKLEEEALTIELAKDRGITVTRDDVTQSIADTLGVPPGGSGTPFERLYRQRLETTKMSDNEYRRLTEAETANRKLQDQIKAELGDGGEAVTLRLIVVSTKDAADQLVSRINSGEDMGTLAQTESADLESRQNDGVLKPTPPDLFPEAIRTAMKGRSPGNEVVGPIESGGYFWVFRLESRDPATVYTDEQKVQLAQAKLDEALKAKRSEVKIVRSLDSSDIVWAEKEAGVR